MSDISWLTTILVGIIPGAQLYARIALLDGSLDKLWLLIPIFFFPPFSFVFAIMMKMGMIEKGKGGKPYDWFMLIPVIFKIMLSFMIPSFLGLFSDEPSNNAIFYTSLILQIIINSIPFIIRMNSLCQKIDINVITKSITDGIFANFGGSILPVLLTFVPFLKIFFNVIEFLPGIKSIINELIWGFGFIITYVIINMFNGDDTQLYCASQLFGKNNFEKIGALITLIATIFINSFNSDNSDDYDDYDDEEE